MGLGKTKSVEAVVTGASLVASFNKANPPLVWKFDLERNHSFTLALQGEEGDWELGLTSPKGDFYPVTHFLTREDAEDAFKEVQKALAGRKLSPLWFGVRMILGMIVLTFILWAALHLRYHHVQPQQGMAAEMPQGVPVPADQFITPPVPEGMPVPADQILKSPH